LQVRVGVRPADVAQPAPGAGVLVVVDQGDEAPVSQRRDDELSEPGHGLLPVQGAGQLGGDRSKQVRSPRGQLGLLLCGAAGADVEEVHRQAVRVGPGLHLVPGAQRRRVVGLEGDRLSGLHGAPVVRLELGADGQRKELPDVSAEHLLAGAAQELLGMPVHVRESPLPVEQEERVRHRLQHPSDARVRPALSRRVVGGAQHLHGRAGVVAQRPAACLDPPDLAVGAHDAVFRGVLTAGIDRRLQRLRHPVRVVRVQPLVERGPGAVEGLAVVPEEVHQPVVPRQGAGRDVQVEGPHAGGLDRQPPGDAAGLVLRAQRRQLQLGHR
jgi:hypothetical protein